MKKMPSVLALILALLTGPILTGSRGYGANLAKAYGENLANIPVSKVASLYKWEGREYDGIRLHLDSKSSYNRPLIKNIAANLLRLKIEMDAYIPWKTPKAIDIFLAPPKANLGGPYLFKEKWTILSGFDDNLENGVYFYLYRGLVQLFLLNGTGTSMKVHPYVLEGMGTLLTERFIQGKSLMGNELKKRAGSSSLKNSIKDVKNPLNLSAHQLLAGRLISDGNSLRLGLGNEDMVLSGEIEKMKCASFFSLIDEYLPDNKLYLLAQKSSIAGISTGNLLPRFSSAIKDVTGKSLTSLVAGWKELLAHTVPDLDKGHFLYSVVGKELREQGEKLAVLMPYRLHPKPEFTATCESGEIYLFSSNSRGQEVVLVSRLGEGKVRFSPLPLSKWRSLEAAKGFGERGSKGNVSPSLKGLNSFFEKIVTAANNRSEDELDKTYEISNAVSPVDSRKFIRQLRKLSVKSVLTEQIYFVDYEVDLGPVNGKEKRRAGFAYRNNRWILISDLAQ